MYVLMDKWNLNMLWITIILPSVKDTSSVVPYWSIPKAIGGADKANLNDENITTTLPSIKPTERGFEQFGCGSPAVLVCGILRNPNPIKKDTFLTRT
jgi:hypothetical protein